jgi:hypothetical protein
VSLNGFVLTSSAIRADLNGLSQHNGHQLLNRIESLFFTTVNGDILKGNGCIGRISLTLLCRSIIADWLEKRILRANAQ